MSDSAKRNKISPLSLFYILFICRIVVSLTSVHSVSTTEINSQALISFVIAMLCQAEADTHFFSVRFSNRFLYLYEYIIPYFDANCNL